MKKTIWIIIGIAVIILGGIGFFAYKAMNDYTNIIRLNRGIEIPKKLGYEELYSKDQGASFHGDGVRYHVYSYENEEVVESMLDWINVLETEETDFFGLADIRLDKLDIKTKYSPIITQVIYAYYNKQQDNSEILILRNDIEKKLYIIESFL